MLPRILPLLLLVLASCPQHQVFSLPVTVQVVAALRSYFRSGCVFFFMSKNESLLALETDALLVQMHRLLSQHNVPIGVLDVRNSNVSLKCHTNQPMYVLLSSGPDVRDFLHGLARMSKNGLPTWLLWLSDVSAEDFLSTVHVPFDCELLVAHRRGGNVTLTELYRVAAGLPLQSYPFGAWSPSTGLTAPDVALFQRRRNLQGLVITAGNQNNPPFTVVKSTDPPVIEGFFGEVWKLLEESLNYTTVHHLLPEGNWGVKLKNDSWTGIVGLLARGEVHMSATSIAMSASRQKEIDFVMPLYLSLDYVFIREGGNEAIDWLHLVQPFHARLWLVVGATVLLLAVALATFQRRDRKWRYSFCTLLFLTSAAVLCVQSQNNTPASAPCRIMYLVKYWVGMLLVSVYSASQTSVLSVRKFELPFTTLRGLLEDGTYQLGVPRGSSTYNMFRAAKRGLLRELYHRVMKPEPENHPKDNLDGMNRVCQWTRYGFIGDYDEVMELEARLSCKITTIPEAFSQSSLSFAIAVGSPYRRLFNYHLQKLRSRGVLQQIKTNTVKPHKVLQPPPLNSMHIHEAAPLLVLFATGALVALALLGAERLVHTLAGRWQTRRRVGPT